MVKVKENAEPPTHFIDKDYLQHALLKTIEIVDEGFDNIRELVKQRQNQEITALRVEIRNQMIALRDEVSAAIDDVRAEIAAVAATHPAPRQPRRFELHRCYQA
ncbi:hypothetical protein [Bradyrhizobium sp. CCBAU 51627]|uniref:hypothetical protein n=1 Tax=Bradyrhizobium sp. CCBAU 51627 TaxID=1325088 RepID=UPI002306D82E|nr:hypothetical protein [Bradyrhizobium sp. CCBAU 51627]MDA9431659.1 hypothetical protein [Bradyrhizobium sp. CCBAU 51627]